MLTLGDGGRCTFLAGGTCWYAAINDTPYTMHLIYKHAYYKDGNSTFDSPFEINPATTLQPGQKTVFALSEGQDLPWWSWTACDINWAFTDVDGNQHMFAYSVLEGNGQPYTTSNDANSSGGWFNSTSTFHTQKDPDGYFDDVDAVLSHPAVVNIDASTDPARATSVMQQLWDTGTNKQFTPTTGVTFNTGPFHRASAMVVNTSNEPATLTLSATDEQDETTSLGLKVGWSTSLDILGFADTQISASVTGGHKWTTSTSDSDSDAVMIDPGDEGYIEVAEVHASVTGNFSFTTPQGITYNVQNATIDEPGMAQNGPNGAYTFRGHEQPINSLGSSRGALQALRPHPRGRPHAIGADRLVLRRGSGRCQRFQGKVHNVATCSQWLTTVGNGDSTVVIDAKADPKSAAAAMSLFAAATNKSFTATVNPIYTNTNQSVLSNYWETEKDYRHASTGTLTATTTNASSWSIGGSVGAEASLGALGFANASVSVEFTAEHEWVTSHSDSQSVSATVDPGYIDWIEGYTREVTFTGDYAFTANGVNYQVNNVTITEPGNSETGPMSSQTYIVISHMLKSKAATLNPRPGSGPASAIPVLIGLKNRIGG